MRPASLSTLSSAAPNLLLHAVALAALTRKEDGARQQQDTCYGAQSQNGDKGEWSVASCSFLP